MISGTTRRLSVRLSCHQWRSATPCSEQVLHWTTYPAGPCPTTTETGYFLTLIPHPDAPVVYGRLEIWVSADYVIEKLIYYDQRGDVLQTADFSDIIEVDKRKFATTIVIEDAYGDKTIQRIEEPQFDLELDASFFSFDTFDSWENH